jgi:uncharacterized caspase-like protein
MSTVQKTILNVICFLFIGLFATVPAVAKKQVALIIGNGTYINAPILRNPVNDAADMSAVLTHLGFTVFDGYDLRKIDMDRKILEFAASASHADTAVFFYSGHGLQVAGANYLIPIDAKMSTEASLDFEATKLDVVQKIMERGAKTSILFLDACRDNPYSGNLASVMGTRSASLARGLAPTNSGVGTLISFPDYPPSSVQFLPYESPKL